MPPRHAWIVRTLLAAAVTGAVHPHVAAGARAARLGAVEIEVRPGVVRPGDAFVIEADCQCDARAASITAPFADRPLPMFRHPSPGKWRAILGIDLDRPPGPYAVTLAFEPAEGPGLSTVHTIEVAGREFATRRLNVAPAFVNPPAGVERRIAEEAARLRALFATTTDLVPAGPARPPVPTRVNSNFGSRSVFNGQARSPHAGVDFSGAVGTPILAPAAGIVVLAGDLYFTGQTVVLDHGHGLLSVLAHLSSIAVAEGARVESGSVVGALGATGRVTGPHLHWGVRLHGARVDPLSVLQALQTD